MKEKMEKNDFLNLINLKGQLINFDEKRLKELYADDYDDYILFLNSVGILLNVEPEFLLLNDEYIDRIHAVIELHRFSTASVEVKEFINDIIVAINKIERLPEKEKKEYKYEYLLEQEYLRDTSFYTEDEFVYSLNFDSFLAYVLKNSEMDSLEKCDDEMTVMSINYMLELCPDLFVDPVVERNTIIKLETIAPKMGKRREKIKIYAENLQKILVKVFKGE